MADFYSAVDTHDGRSAADMLDGIGPGQALLADAAYDSDALRRQMKAQGGWLCAKPVSYRRQKPPFSRWLYRFRNVVERFFNRIKHCRAIATRYEKHDDNYFALIKLAAIRLWIGNNESSGNLWPLPSELIDGSHFWLSKLKEGNSHETL